MLKNVGEQLASASLLLAGAGIETHLLDAQLIMAHVLGLSKLGVIAHPELELSSTALARFAELVAQRAQRCPLAYIVGSKEFYGLEISVTPGVLVPRPETEVLVEETIKRVRERESPLIADIGSGSGAIAVALAANLPEARIFATEIAPEAVQTTQRNIEKHELSDRVTLLAGDLVAPIAGLDTLLDAIVSNPPYIPSADIETLQPEVRDYEPRLALDGGPDGLDAYRRLFSESIGLLKSSGFVAVEIGQGEAKDVVQIAAGAGFSRAEVIPDLAGIERVVIGYR